MYRWMLVIVTTALGVGATTVGANPQLPPSCRLVIDPAGDARNSVTVPPETSDAALDVVSADVATDARALTAVIRVVDLAGIDGATRLGSQFGFWFDAGEIKFAVSAHIGPDGRRFLLSRAEPASSAGPVTASLSDPTIIAEISGVLDVANDEIRMTAPLRAFDAHYPLRAGDRLYDLSVATWSGAHAPYPLPGALVSVDAAWGERSYQVHRRSCVRVGR